MTDHDRSKDARGLINSLIVVGALVSVVGGVLLYAFFPDTVTTVVDSSDFSGSPTTTTEDTGQPFIAIIGAVMNAVGGLMLIVGAIGMGVRLGNEASHSRPVGGDT